MIAITNEKSFIKRAKKWVLPKDFIVADATDSSDSEIQDYGQRIQCQEMVPTSVLLKIAKDPYSAESRIKAQNLNRYLSNWLDDDGLNMRLLMFMNILMQNHEREGDDMSIFIVMGKEAYREYAQALLAHIQSIYGPDSAYLVTSKMEKDEQKKRIMASYPKEVYQKIARAVADQQRVYANNKFREMYQL